MTSTTKSECTLAFLGTRTYVQGPTLFDAVLPLVPNGASLSFKVSGRLMTDRVALSRGDGPPPAGQPSASLAWQQDGRQGWITIDPLDPSPDPRREPYDEASLVQLMTFTEATAELRQHSPFSFGTTITSMLKALLHRQRSMDSAGQWLFVRLDLDIVPPRETFTPLTVAIDAAALRGNIVRARVSAQDKPVGTLYFAWSPA